MTSPVRSLVPAAAKLANKLFSLLRKIDKTLARTAITKMAEKYYSRFCSKMKRDANHVCVQIVELIFQNFIECSSSLCYEDFGMSADAYVDGIHEVANHDVGKELANIQLGDPLPELSVRDPLVNMIIETLRLYNSGVRL